MLFAYSTKHLTRNSPTSQSKRFLFLTNECMLHLYYLILVLQNKIHEMKGYCKMFPISPRKSRQYFKTSGWSNLVSGGAPSVPLVCILIPGSLLSPSSASVRWSIPLLCLYVPFLLLSISFHTPVIMSPPPSSPILLLNGTHWPWLICCVWLNERSFTYLITMATGINDRWPLGRNTEVLKKKKKTLNLLRLY